jgi:outer membrane lipopolysaccharide assembly protein LptE/RlpB
VVSLLVQSPVLKNHTVPQSKHHLSSTTNGRVTEMGLMDKKNYVVRGSSRELTSATTLLRDKILMLERSVHWCSHRS